MGSETKIYSEGEPQIWCLQIITKEDSHQRRNEIKSHQSLTRLPNTTWTDLQGIKELDGRSVNFLISEGCRLVVKDKLELISQQRKRRNTLNDMVGV